MKIRMLRDACAASGNQVNVYEAGTVLDPESVPANLIVTFLQLKWAEMVEGPPSRQGPAVEASKEEPAVVSKTGRHKVRKEA